MKNKIISIVLLFILISSTSIQSKEGQHPDWEGKIEDKEGVQVVTNPPEPLYGQMALELEEDLVIGDADDAKFRFFKWISLDVDFEGNIYVLDRGSFRIQKYDKEGRFVQTIGREGQGPGEFDQPEYLTLDEKGRIVVKDGTKAQIFDQTGEFVRSFPILISSNHFKITSGGNFLGERMTIRPPDELFEGVALMNETGGLLKEIARFPSIRMDSLFNRKDRLSIQVPELQFCSSIKDCAVYGFSSEYRLYTVDSEGLITRIIEVEGAAEKISSKERQKIIDVALGQIQSRPSAKQEARADFEKRVLIPKNRPFFDKIRMDEDGYIFAEKLKSYLSQDTVYEFDVFNGEGFYLYRVKIPRLASNLSVFRGGCLYFAPYSEAIGYFQVKRYKVKNWSRLKRGGVT